MTPLDLIKTANKIAGSGKRRRPRQSDLKRAVSTAYYAMFHALCRNCADRLIGTTSQKRSSPAWRQAYRAVEHGHAKRQCNNQQIIGKFPDKIQAFAGQFVTLQEKRHQADYDPHSKFSKHDVKAAIKSAELAIKDLQSSTTDDKSAFAAWTVMKNRQN